MPVPKPPAQLKSLMPFITRAHQIEKTDPVIAYWCYFWAVQIVLAGNLHSGDAEATQYTTALLDDLEARKEKLLPNDAITDDLAAQAYVENFATRVFNNADNVLQARKVSRQTADNFLAASTFLELCKIFPNVDSEILSKIKFAKYQASRIIKAFQAGEDPNLPLSETIQMEDDGESQNRGPPKPTVEDIQDEDGNPHTLQPQHHQIPSRSASPPTPPSNMSQPITRSEPRTSSTSTSDRFPLHHQPSLSLPPQAQPDNDYFPTIPIGRSLTPLSPDRTTSNTPAGPMSPFHMPVRAEPPFHPPPADAIRTDTDDIPQLPPHLQYPSAPPPTQFPPQHFDQSSALHTRPTYTPPPPPPSLPYTRPSSSHQYYSTTPPSASPFIQPGPPRSAPQPRVYQAPQPHSQPPPPPQQQQQQHETFADEESITKAQKHAKWAISALNYDDIPTAVKELRAALRTLGAS